MPKDLNKEFDQLIFDICLPVFKALSFKKSGTNFYRQTEELIQTFNFQKSSFSSKSELTFTGNIGFIEPGTHLKLYQVDSLPKFPKCIDSIIQFRLGEITNGGDYWYRITANGELDLTAAILRKDVSKVQELFATHTTIRSLEGFINDRTKINPFWGEAGQFALLKKLGRDKEASQILANVYKTAKKPRSWVSIKERVKGIWTEKRSEPAVNPYLIERIEKVAELYQEKLT